MAWNPGVGQPMVNERFNQMCSEAMVEAKISHNPNPGDPMSSIRVVTFTNFNKSDYVTVREFDGKEHIILPQGTLMIGIQPDRELPTVLKGSKNDNV